MRNNSWLITLLFTVCVAGAPEWPRFRGVDGKGVWEGGALPDRWETAWAVESPPGASSPVSDGQRVFLTAYRGDERIVLCYRLADGKELWRRTSARGQSSFFHEMHGPATPTPAIDGGQVFVFFPDTGLLSYDANGKELWRQPLGPFRSVQGLAASPVVADGVVGIVVDTPEESFAAAYRQRDGALLWRRERPLGVLGGYATPTVARDAAGHAQLIVAGAGELTAYDLSTGERLWWAQGITSYPIAPPFVSGADLYTSEPAGVGWPAWSDPLGKFDRDGDGRISMAEAAGDASWLGSLRGIDRNAGNGDGQVTAEEYAQGTSGNAGGLFRLRLGGRGDVSKSHVVWRQTRSVPPYTGALLYGDLLYSVRRGILGVYDPASGRLRREARIPGALGEYYASPVAGDGKIYLASHEGVVTVIRAGVEWQVLATQDLGEAILATPAIANHRIVVRTAKRLHCFAAPAQRPGG